MKHHFDPGEVQALCKAFDVAWRAVEKEATTTSNCEAIRDHMGRAIVRMAMSGKMNERRLASCAYSARLFLGRRVGSITLPCDTARM